MAATLSEDLLGYLTVYHSCIRRLFRSCLVTEYSAVGQNQTFAEKTISPCGIRQILVKGFGSFQHNITIRNVFQIQLTFTKFFLTMTPEGKCHLQKLKVNNYYLFSLNKNPITCLTVTAIVGTLCHIYFCNTSIICKKKNKKFKMQKYRSVYVGAYKLSLTLESLSENCILRQNNSNIYLSIKRLGV